MTKRRVTQETFDETVKENLDEFEMSREEAVKDAIKQFTSQGVDLGNICVTYDAGDDAWMERVTGSFNVLAAMSADGKEDTRLPAADGVLPALVAVKELCSCSGVGCCSERTENARKYLAAKQAANVLSRYCTSEERDVRLAALDGLEALCDGHEESRDSFWPMSMTKICQAAQRHADDREYMKRFKRVVRVICTKTENNKVNFVAQSGLDLILSALEMYRRDPEVTLEICLAAKAVTAVDDLRKDFSAAHNTTRQLLNKGGIPRFVEVARTYRSDSRTMAAALGMLKNMALTEESVSQIVKEGGLELVGAALEAHPDHAVLCGSAISVMRNVSADDNFKELLCNNGMAELMLKAMRKHSQDVRLVEHGLATIAAMALRSPSNAVRLVGMGAGYDTLQAMRQHQKVPFLQRQACLAVRNLVSRNSELKSAFLEADAESLLRQAGQHQESVDEAYAALRDLGCEVKRLVVDTTTGQVSDAVELFGAVKTNFNHVFESSDEIETSISKAVSEPSQSYRF